MWPNPESERVAEPTELEADAKKAILESHPSQDNFRACEKCGLLLKGTNL